MRGARLELSPGACFAAAALFFFLRPRELAALLTALLAHELGHLAAILSLGLRPREFRADLGGFCLAYTGETGPLCQLLIAAAGPAAGFAYAALAARLGRESGQDWLCLSAGLSLLLSVFNLLPAPSLDGGRILAPLACGLFGSRRGEKLCRVLGLITALLLLGVGLFVLLRRDGAALLIAGACLLLPQLREGLVKN